MEWPISLFHDGHCSATGASNREVDLCFFGSLILHGVSSVDLTKSRGGQAEDQQLATDSCKDNVRPYSHESIISIKGVIELSCMHRMVHSNNCL